MLVRILLLTVLAAAGTWLIGWWAVPLIALLYALYRREGVAPTEVAVATMLAWSALILVNVGAPAFRILVARLGGVFPVPGAVVLLVSVLFAGLLAWSCARVVLGVVGLTPRRAPA